MLQSRLWGLAGSCTINPTGKPLTSVGELILSLSNSKSCHVKNFGTKDLRQANLPYREFTPESDDTRSTSPLHNTILPSPPRLAAPLRINATNGTNGSSKTSSISAPRQTTSPIDPSFPPNTSQNETTPDPPASSDTKNIDATPTTPPRHAPSPTPSSAATPSNTGRPGLGGIPRTVPLTPTRSVPYGSYASPARRHLANNSIGGTPSQTSGDTDLNSTPAIRPIVPTATGTRYGAALTSNLTGSPKRWGASTNPSCPRCGKSVYFAEQIKAVGKTFHKNCLRCTECNTLLDSSRLRDHDGDPLCMHCYGKLHGPQGGGYALLGKAGG
ncbi:hypothetical protein C0991_000619 [Blastosporella zonata]|nr:hypothetical protein C0991_000619 [Blastosporella zonata]